MWKKVRQKKHVKTRLVILAILLAAGGVSGYMLLDKNSVNNQNSDENASTLIVADDPASQPEATSDDTQSPEVVPLFDNAELQKTLTDWDNALGGVASVVVMDEDGTELASIDGDRVYFAASIYKLYVAYFGYQQVDVGAADPAESYINGHTRAECLDLMIRESDSPCGEKMLAELNQQEPAENDPLGIVDRVPIRLEITSSGVAELLKRIASSDGLSDTSQQALLESMQTQIYRDALNKGFSDSVTVYNKIGFRGFDEYHDTAIVELADGRRFVLSVLTTGVGTRNIAELGRRVEAIVKD